jgi:hypothetical protein
LTPTGHQAQLEWEARVGRFAAAAAIGSAVCSLAGSIVQLTAFSGVGDGDREGLIAIDDKASQLWLATTLRDLGILLLGFVLYYLYRVTRHRQGLPGIVVPLIALAPALLVIASILGQADVISIAGDFTESGVTDGRAGETRADNLLDERSVVGTAVGAGGTLSMALALVLVNLNAMRAGILSRFMGIVGIVTGALLVLPLLAPLPVVQLFWLGALAALFLGRWPGGRGPAWETGEAVPWPSAAQLRAESLGERLRDEPEPGPQPEAGGELEPGPAPAEHPVSQRRKRKRRR